MYHSEPLCPSLSIDPLVKKQVNICSSSLEACKDAEAIVIATEWKEFKEIDWETVYQGMNKPAFVFDGRLLVDEDKLTKIGFKVGLRIPIESIVLIPFHYCDALL